MQTRSRIGLRSSESPRLSETLTTDPKPYTPNPLTTTSKDRASGVNLPKPTTPSKIRKFLLAQNLAFASETNSERILETVLSVSKTGNVERLNNDRNRTLVSLSKVNPFSALI